MTDNVNGNKTYTPNALNQYSAVTGSTVTNGYEHEVASFNGVTYTYINDERLKQASDGSNTYTLTYDALGRCVKRTLNGTDTYYVYDGEKPILEYNTNGTRVGFNLYGKGIDEILERGANGTDNAWHWYFFQQDHEGSVTHLTDGSGNIIERYRYDAFGAPSIYALNWSTRSSTIYDNRFLFTGREYAATYRSTYNVAAFKFYEYRARAYNPTLGRFMSEDPKLFVRGTALGNVRDDWSFEKYPDEAELNLFRYCHNDPLDYTDPTGLITIIIPGYGPGQSQNANSRWSNQQFIGAALKRFKDGQVFRRDQMKSAMQAIEAARASGDKTLNIVGYSLGAAAGVKLAADAGKAGITVNKLVTIDIVRATGFDSHALSNPVNVPSNVKQAYNYYQQTGGGLLHPTNFKGTPVVETPNVIANRLMQEHHASMPNPALRSLRC